MLSDGVLQLHHNDRSSFLSLQDYETPAAYRIFIIINYYYLLLTKLTTSDNFFHLFEV